MKLLKLNKTQPERGLVAKVDDEDFDRLDRHDWTITASGHTGHEIHYAFRWSRDAVGKRFKIWLHREVIGCPPGLVPDHKNGDGLDCQKDNLKIVTPEQNNLNARMKSWHTRKSTAEDICL